MSEHMCLKDEPAVNASDCGQISSMFCLRAWLDWVGSGLDLGFITAAERELYTCRLWQFNVEASSRDVRDFLLIPLVFN